MSLKRNELVRLVKQAAEDAVRADAPMDIGYGTVTSATPLKIQVESRILSGCATMITDIGGTKINGVESNLALHLDSIPVRGEASG